MNKENAQKLLNDFPGLYRPSDGFFNEYVFQCDDGWFQLIYDLSSEITAAAKNKVEVPFPMVMQVKEKFGGLRFYVNSNKLNIDAAIEKAEEKSLITCEKCGSPGKIRSGSWSRVRCEPCDLEDQKDLIKGV